MDVYLATGWEMEAFPVDEGFVCFIVRFVRVTLAMLAGGTRRGRAQHRAEEGELGPEAGCGKEIGEAGSKNSARDRWNHPSEDGGGTMEHGLRA